MGFLLLLCFGVLVGALREGRVGGIESFKNHCEESKINQMYLILK